MTNAEHIFGLIKEWVTEHEQPITRIDLIQMGISEYHVKQALEKLVKENKLRRSVRGYGYVLVGK